MASHNTTLGPFWTVAKCIVKKYSGVIGVFVFALILLAEPAAAETSVNQLEILQVLNRIHKILRNIAYLLGPIVLIHGILLWFVSSRNSDRAQHGMWLTFGGAVLFGSALAMDVILQLVVWLATHGVG